MLQDKAGAAWAMKIFHKEAISAKEVSQSSRCNPSTARVSLCSQVHAVMREANLMRRVEGHKHIVQVRCLLAVFHNPLHVAGAADPIAV